MKIDSYNIDTDMMKTLAELVNESSHSSLARIHYNKAIYHIRKCIEEGEKK